MALQLKKAKRSNVYLKMGIASPSGGGKTAGALLIAYGMLKEKYPNLSDAEIWQKTAIVDSENGSGELYVNHNIGRYHIGEYNAITLEPPFEAGIYIEAIRLCEKNGIEVCIIDSASHLWTGQGGLLEQQANIARKGGNSYTAWRDVTPEHSRFVDAMLQCNMHIIATMRSKVEHVQEKDEKGKITVRKIGLRPIQREGMEYEFTLFLDIDETHHVTVSKDRTSIFDNKSPMVITPDVGSKLMTWAMSGTDEAVQVIDSVELKPADAEDGIRRNKARIKELVQGATPEIREQYKTIFLRYNEEGNPNMVKDPEKQASMLSEMEQLTLDK